MKSGVVGQVGYQLLMVELNQGESFNIERGGLMYYDSIAIKGSHATELDVSSFDTSNVTRMAFMFSDSQATELDLSSFDTSTVTNMSEMFNNSKAKTVYARTQADADKYNESSNKPNGLQVVVKQ